MLPSGCIFYFLFFLLFFLLLCTFETTHSMFWIIKTQLKNPLSFLSAFLTFHSNALINQTHLEASKESGIHKGFIFTISHLHALATPCPPSKIRQKSTDWLIDYFFFNCIPAKILLGKKQRYDIRFLGALTQAYLSEIKSPVNSLLQLLFSRLW